VKKAARLSMRLPLTSPRGYCMEKAKLKERVVRWWNLLPMALKNPSPPSLQRIFDRQDVEKGRTIKERE
jgi:hypothetical protein